MIFLEINIKQVVLIVLKKLPVIISCALILGIISFVIAYKREDKRGLHDLIAKTKVVLE